MAQNRSAPKVAIPGHVQAHTVAQHFAMVSGLNDMFPGNGVQWGLRYVFS